MIKKIIKSYNIIFSFINLIKCVNKNVINTDKIELKYNDKFIIIVYDNKELPKVYEYKENLIEYILFKI